MVFGTFARLSRYSRACYENVKGGTPFGSRCRGQPFFNPSYRNPDDLVLLDEVGHRKESQNKTNYSKYSTVLPSLTVTKNYVIFDPYNRRKKKDQDDDEDETADLDDGPTDGNGNRISRRANLQRIMLKRVNHSLNRNSHLKISIESMNAAYTTLGIRRSSSNAIKRVVVATEGICPDYKTAMNGQQRAFSTSTTDLAKLKEEMEKLKLSEEPQGVKFTMEIEKPGEEEDEEEKEVADNVEQKVNAQTAGDFAPQTYSDEEIIDNMMAVGKVNEVLSVYLRLRSNNIVPSIKVYNKVMESIRLRETDETMEQKLTNLLNVYSDMISNSIKPDDISYELVIKSLVEGSLHTYQMAQFKEGGDFLKIALELFFISHNNESAIMFKDRSIYRELLECLNCYQMVTSTDIKTLYEILKNRMAGDNTLLLSFYLQLIRFASLKRDFDSVQLLYNELRSEIDDQQLKNSQYRIYCSLIEAMNFCGEIQRSSIMLDQIIKNMDSRTARHSQEDISALISSFLKSQAWIDPYRAYDTFLKFNRVDWMPDFTVEALSNLFASFLVRNDLKMASKVYDYDVIREDFDRSIDSLPTKLENNFLLVHQSFDKYVDLLIVSGDKNLLLKVVREILLKKSLVLSDPMLVRLLDYLEQEGYYELANKFIIDQGLKKNEKRDVTLNNYLSLIVDFIKPEQIKDICDTKYFKKTVEQYRLTRDNAYGLMTVFKNITSKLSPNELKLKFAYYTKVLNYEFDDAANFYVNLPDEVRNFKERLSTLCQELSA